MAKQQYESHFGKDKCDCCGSRTMGVMVERYGVPVFFQCSMCGPGPWKDLGERQVSAWLSGKDPRTEK